MRTFIWADTHIYFTECQFFVAQADNVDEARRLLKNQLQCRVDSVIKELEQEKADGVINIWDYERQSKSVKRHFDNEIELINRYEPSHIIGAGMAMRILHGNE
jgi:hypothetical protein